MANYQIYPTSSTVSIGAVTSTSSSYTYTNGPITYIPAQNIANPYINNVPYVISTTGTAYDGSWTYALTDAEVMEKFLSFLKGNLIQKAIETDFFFDPKSTRLATPLLTKLFSDKFKLTTIESCMKQLDEYLALFLAPYQAPLTPENEDRVANFKTAMLYFVLGLAFRQSISKEDKDLLMFPGGLFFLSDDPELKKEE